MTLFWGSVCQRNESSVFFPYLLYWYLLCFRGNRCEFVLLSFTKPAEHPFRRKPDTNLPHVACAAFVVYDDLVLQRWLCHNSVKTSEKIYRCVEIFGNRALNRLHVCVITSWLKLAWLAGNIGSSLKECK